MSYPYQGYPGPGPPPPPPNKPVSPYPPGQSTHGAPSPAPSPYPSQPPYSNQPPYPSSQSPYPASQPQYSANQASPHPQTLTPYGAPSPYPQTQASQQPYGAQQYPASIQPGQSPYPPQAPPSPYPPPAAYNSTYNQHTATGPGYQQQAGSPYPYGNQQAHYGTGYGQPPPQGQGYPPQPSQGQSGYPPGPPAGPAQIQGFKQALTQCIQEHGLQNFYPPNSPILDSIAAKAGSQVPGLCQRWKIPQEIGNDLVKLGLYDIVIYIDDSGSMQFEEGGERIKDLQLILQRVASVATIFDDDGISLRFMNANYPIQQLENIRSEQQIDQLMRTVQFKGLTPMGTELKNKVIDGIIVPKVRSGQYRKPTLVIVITDGQPAGEATNTVFDTIKYASGEVSRQFGAGGIAFQFAQVGNDQKAREFLGKLDEDPVVGRLVDCTSNFENESEEMQRQGVNLTPELWLIKLLLGAIDSTYDRKDEKAGGAPPGQYGAPPGQYGGPPAQYGQPGGAPPGQYGAPPQGYGGQPGYPPQQYGAPPQQGGYPPQQGQGRGYSPYPPQGGQGGPGGYGAPPPPQYR